MAHVSVGVDAIEIQRIRNARERFGERFLRRVYTEREQSRYANRISELAARFAGKEAISKALGTGLKGVAWREMEILPNPRGKPLVYLHGRALERARYLGLRQFAISLTHTNTLAIAFVVASSDENPVEGIL